MIVLYVGYGLCVVGLMVAGATAVFQSEWAGEYAALKVVEVSGARVRDMARSWLR